MDNHDLLLLADQCVKCGLCLPRCPTFQLLHNEADSPRGRIALIQGLATGQIDDGPRAAVHLDGCLECRACELACPSLVQFGTLMDAARAARVARLPAPRRRLRRLRLDVLASASALPLLAALASLYRSVGLGALARTLGLLRLPRLRVLHGLAMRLRRPRQPGPLDAPHAADPHPSAADASPVVLFRGCVARALEPEVMDAALRVFARLGVSVSVPEAQRCCGAMHRHNGFPEAADRYLDHNRAVFGDATVVVGASACAAELKPAVASVELCRALLDLPWPEGLQPAPLEGVVAVHEPCSQRNQLRDADAAYALLRRVPGLEIVPLPGNDTCCGAAGTYLLDQPELALRLAEPKVQALSTLRPRWLVSTNTGCAAHLGAAASAAGLDVEVLHPVVLLARALDSSAV